MRFYNRQHHHYCGIDLHVKSMYAPLKWAFSEAAVLFLRHTKDGKKLLTGIEKKHGKGKALSILAHKIGGVSQRSRFFLIRRPDGEDLRP